MIVTELYNGQGLGNQLWCYFVTRIIAYQNNFDFGIKSRQKFKGSEFLEIDFGKDVYGGSGPEGGPPIDLPDGINFYYKEKMTRYNDIDISKFDKLLFDVQDNTKIDGIMQSINYIKNYRNLIRSWIRIKSEYNILNYTSDNICVIHIRGGDFRGSLAVLYSDYYTKSVEQMRIKNPNMIFYVVTDDVEFSKSILPDIEIIGGSATNTSDSKKASHHIGGPIWIDWTILFNCKNVIMSASSFSFWPVWLNEKVNVIAPMYWAGYKSSDGYWSTGDTIVDDWFYLNRSGEIFNSKECLESKSKYEKTNSALWE